MSALLQDREEGGLQLSRALISYKNSNAVVVGIPRGGVCVAYVISQALSVPLEVMSCRSIADPADRSRNLGSVCEDGVFIDDTSHSIPQDYVAHQIALLRNSISYETQKYYGATKRLSLQFRPVIIVDDILAGSENMMACIHSIRNQRPLRIIVAVPVVSADAARVVSAEVDDFRFIKMEQILGRPREYYANYPKIDEKKVKALLDASRRQLKIYE